MLQILTYLVFFGEIHVFLQNSWIYLLEQAYPSSTLKLLSCRKYSFQKLSQFAWGNNVHGSHASHTGFFFSRDTCVSSSYLKSPIWNKEPFYTLKILSCRKYFFEKHTQFLQGNNVLVAPPSNIYGSLWRYTFVSLTKLNWPIWNKMNLSLPWKLWFAEVFLSKTNSILTGKQCTSCSYF
jgi:hypothetical protein